MTRKEAIVHIKDIICENNTIKPDIVVFEQEKEALYMAIQALEQEPKTERPQKSCDTCEYSDEINGNNCYECVKGMRNNYNPQKQEPKTDYKAFAEWVAREIFDDYWEYNKEAFAEIACRKLAKLGIVIRMGDEWELVEQEGEKV